MGPLSLVPGRAVDGKAIARSDSPAQRAGVPSLQVCYQDHDVILLTKPPGRVVVRRPGDPSGPTLSDEVKAAGIAAARPFHHLDAEASGLTGYALNKPALDFLSGQLQGKTAQGEYWALVVVATPAELAASGAPSWRDMEAALPAAGEWDWRLIEDPDVRDAWRVARRRAGRAALTRFRVMEDFGRFAWLSCWPTNGRAAQARAHLAAAGLPVLNDPLYGPPGVELRLSGLKRGYKGKATENPLVSHLALHLGALTLRHPATREWFTVTTPPPDPLEIALKNLRRYRGRGVSRR